MRKFSILVLFIMLFISFNSYAARPEYYKGDFKSYSPRSFNVGDREFKYNNDLVVIRIIRGAQADFQETISLREINRGEALNVIYYGDYASLVYVGAYR